MPRLQAASMRRPWTNNGVQVRCGARTDREQRQSSAPCDLRERHRQDETRRTVDLGHSSDAPIMDRPRRESRHHNGITLRGVSQSTFATWGNSGIEPDKGKGISSPGSYEASLMWPPNDGERQWNTM